MDVLHKAKIEYAPQLHSKSPEYGQANFEIKAMIAKIEAIAPTVKEGMQRVRMDAIASLDKKFQQMEERFNEQLKELRSQADYIQKAVSRLENQ
jgi:coenzyme F420-reducing hydrogenase delta subunit